MFENHLVMVHGDTESARSRYGGGFSSRKDTRMQSLYHLTIGGPVIDNRLQTRPPYVHLRLDVCE
ncbi:MAG: hypothetical protein GF344_05860 [Chitinivibrionales bacterium]|nr:hypothetical protein [Chitinivibrionales bacterium]